MMACGLGGLQQAIAGKQHSIAHGYQQSRHYQVSTQIWSHTAIMHFDSRSTDVATLPPRIQTFHDSRDFRFVDISTPLWLLHGVFRCACWRQGCILFSAWNTTICVQSTPEITNHCCSLAAVAVELPMRSRMTHRYFPPFPPNDVDKTRLHINTYRITSD